MNALFMLLLATSSDARRRFSLEQQDDPISRRDFLFVGMSRGTINDRLQAPKQTNPKDEEEKRFWGVRCDGDERPGALLQWVYTFSCTNTLAFLDPNVRMFRAAPCWMTQFNPNANIYAGSSFAHLGRSEYELGGCRVLGDRLLCELGVRYVLPHALRSPREFIDAHYWSVGNASVARCRVIRMLLDFSFLVSSYNVGAAAFKIHRIVLGVVCACVREREKPIQRWNEHGNSSRKYWTRKKRQLRGACDRQADVQRKRRREREEISEDSTLSGWAYF